MDIFMEQLAECKFSVVGGRPNVAKFLGMLCVASRFEGVKKEKAMGAYKNVYSMRFARPDIKIANDSCYWTFFKSVGEKVIGKKPYVVPEKEQEVLVAALKLMQQTECGEANQINPERMNAFFEMADTYLESENATFADEIRKIKAELTKDLAA